MLGGGFRVYGFVVFVVYVYFFQIVDEMDVFACVSSG